MTEQLIPIAKNPTAERAEKSTIELVREDVQIGQELMSSPGILRYLREEYELLSYKINHLQPAAETDREIAFALNTVNSKLAVLEKLYSFATKLPTAMEAYKNLLDDNESQSE